MIIPQRSSSASSSLTRSNWNGVMGLGGWAGTPYWPFWPGHRPKAVGLRAHGVTDRYHSTPRPFSTRCRRRRRQRRSQYSFPNGRSGTARHGHGPGTARLGTARSGPRACRAMPDSATVPSTRHGHGTIDSGACRAEPFGTAARLCSCRPRHGSSICKLHLFQ
jgi:hypothetical protein